jgi:hypothetical protein
MRIALFLAVIGVGSAFAADELRIEYPTGVTVSAIVTNSSGNVWEPGTGAFEAFGTAGRTLTDYALTVSEAGTGSGIYLGDFPSANTTAGVYLVKFYVSATHVGTQTVGWTGSAVKAATDVNVTYWSGSAVATPSTSGYPMVILQDASLTAAKIADGAITSAKAPNLDRKVSEAKLHSDGLDSVAISVPDGPADDFREMVVLLYRRFFGKVTMTSTRLICYDDDGSTALTTQVLSDDNTTQTMGAAQ